MTPEAGKTPLPVFLSHNRQDRELVREIAEALELEFGIPHYLDEYAIPAGEAFRPWIERAIETSTGCAIFLGGNGWGPTHLWEAERALAHYRKTPGFRLIPVILPGATADDMARLGSGSVFKEINWVDFTKGPRDWQSLEKFREAVTGQRRDGTRGPARLTPYLLRRDAARWQASGGKDRSLLYRGHELQEAERVAVENPDLAGGNEVTLFLSACTRHERNRLRTLATISIAVALALAGLSLFAWQQQQEADVQRDEAVKQQGIARKQTEIALTEKSIADKERQKAVEQRQIADQQRKIAEQQTKRAIEQQSLAEDRLAIALSRSLATQAQVLWEAGGASRQTSLLLALEALKHFPTWEADQSVRRGLRELPVHLGRIRDVGRLADLRVSYDGRYFATSSNAGGIRVWVTDGLKELAGLRQEEASTAVFSPVRNDLLFGKDGFLHIVEVPSGRSRGALRHHRQDVIPLAISADGKYLLTEQYDVSEAGFIERRELLLWDLPAQRRIRSVETQSTVGQNYGDAFFFTTPFGTYLAAGWRLYEVWGLDGAAAGQYQAEGLLSPNGAYVLEFEDRQGGWKILNRQSRQVVLQGDEPLDRGRFSPDGLYAFLDSWGRPLQIWSLEQRTKVGEINLTSDPRILERDGSTAVVGYEVMARTSTVRLTPDRKVLLAETRIGDDYHLDAWETRSHISTASFDADWQIHDVDLSPRGDRLAIASGRDFRTWDLELHRKAVDIPHQSLQEHILSISYRPDGSELALGVDGGSFGPERGVVLWDLRAQRRQRVLALDSIVTAVAYSPSGRFLAIAAAPSSDSRRDVGALIWDLSRQADTVEKLPESDSTKNVVWSPDGRYLLLASGSDTLIVELARRRTVFRQRWSASASFDRTGNLLVMAVDNRAQIWRLDLVGGRHALLAELFADANIACAAFAPDGVHVATGSVRGVLSIWNRKTKQAVSRIELGEPLRNLAFTPDGRLVVYASEGHVLASVWRPKDLIEEGFRRTADPLTAEQWKQYLGDFRPYPYGEQRLPEVEKRLSASTASRERPGQAAGRPR